MEPLFGIAMIALMTAILWVGNKKDNGLEKAAKDASDYARKKDREVERTKVFIKEQNERLGL